VTKKRTGEPWIPAASYGRLLPPFSVSLTVREIARSVDFYRTVLSAFVHYADPDFAAIKVSGVDLMLHADHTYDSHPWHSMLAAGQSRGLGAELRLLGLAPEGVEERAKLLGAVVIKPVTVRGHGWREVMIEDPDGYVWAVGVLTEPGDEST
jgi:uncharacterized glyoxalase superfamily protein PhnB